MIPMEPRTQAKGATRPSMRRLFSLIAVPVLQLATVMASAQVPSAASDEIQALIGRGTLSQLHRPDFTRLRPALEDIYSETSYAPRWFAPGGAARAMVAELASAPSHGVD